MLVLVLLTIALLAIFLRPLAAASDKLPYLLIDEPSGNILAANRENDRWYPASLTKLMTALVTFRAMASDEIAPGSPVILSPKAAKQPPSKMGYPIGTELRIDTALKIIIVKSANDVSLALAEAVAGNEAAFVKRMNDEAGRLGLSNTHFVNSNGLHSPQQVTTARDIAVLVHAIRTEFPQYTSWFSVPAIRTDKATYYSFDLLLERFPGTTGMKTGFVCASGYNLAATATRNGKSLIAIVFGRDSQTDRAIAGARLLLDGFSGNTSSMGNAYSQPKGKSAPARNMRPQICSESAVKTRYDPEPQDVIINSPYLQPRQPIGQTLFVATGGVDAPPSKAYASQMSANKKKSRTAEKNQQKASSTGKNLPKELRKSKSVQNPIDLTR